jgi:phosphonate transport system ATP-binding protein
VAVARALYQDPVIVLADEPIASLDPRNANDIMQILKPISEQIPICGVFHQPEITSRYCTRVLGIKEGRVVYDGPPDLSESDLEWLYGDELEQLREEEAEETGGDTTDQEPEIGRLVQG